MFLSNPPKIFLIIGFFALFFQGCGSSQTPENKEVAFANEPKHKFPFSMKEPEIFQADLVMTDGSNEDHWFIARKGDKWRYDIFRGGERWMSQLRSGKLYDIDYSKKTFREVAESTSRGGEAGDIGEITRNFFRGEEHREFDEIGRENGLIKYKVREMDGSAGEVVIYVDAASGVMVKEEFTGKKDRNDAGSPVSWVYELRNLKMDVDDGVFEIPAGYKKVAAETSPPSKGN